MTFYSIASTATTVLLFLSFLGIVAWAYSRRRAAAFEAAANAPFALPDEIGAEGIDGTRAERRSAARLSRGARPVPADGAAKPAERASLGEVRQ